MEDKLSNIYIYCGECPSVLFFFGKKRGGGEMCINQRMKITDGLSEATGIYPKCLSNIHTEFLANDGNFLSLIPVLHQFKG